MSYTYMPRQRNVEELPFLNVANGNAHIPAAMMGVDFDSDEIPVAGLESAKLRLTVTYGPAFTRETTEINEPGRAHVVFCGVTDDQVERYRSQLLTIIDYCIKHNCPLSWM